MKVATFEEIFLKDCQCGNFTGNLVILCHRKISIEEVSGEGYIAVKQQLTLNYHAMHLPNSDRIEEIVSS